MQCLSGRTRLISVIHPDELAEIEFPYYDKKKKKEQNVTENMERSCRKKNSCFWYRHVICFEVVRLDKAFVEKYKETFAKRSGNL